MSTAGFSRTLIFGAVAAAAAVTALLLVAPFGLVLEVRVAALAGLAALYVVGLARRPARAIGWGGLVFLLVAAAGVLSPHPDVLVLGAAASVGLVRSGFLFASQRLRGLAIELLVGGAAVVSAHVFGSGGALGFGAAIWGFFLGQSLFFVVGGVRSRRPAEPEEDAFAAAHRRARRILEHAR